MSIPNGFLRLTDVLKIIPVSRSTWFAGVKSGRFPQSLKLGERIVVWRSEDIREFMNQIDTTQKKD